MHPLQERACALPWYEVHGLGGCMKAATWRKMQMMTEMPHVSAIAATFGSNTHTRPSGNNNTLILLHSLLACRVASSHGALRSSHIHTATHVRFVAPELYSHSLLLL